LLSSVTSSSTDSLTSRGHRDSRRRPARAQPTQRPATRGVDDATDDQFAALLDHLTDGQGIGPDDPAWSRWHEAKRAKGPALTFRRTAGKVALRIVSELSELDVFGAAEATTDTFATAAREVAPAFCAHLHSRLDVLPQTEEALNAVLAPSAFLEAQVRDAGFESLNELAAADGWEHDAVVIATVFRLRSAPPWPCAIQRQRSWAARGAIDLPRSARARMCPVRRDQAQDRTGCRNSAGLRSASSSLRASRRTTTSTCCSRSSSAAKKASSSQAGGSLSTVAICRTVRGSATGDPGC
jgi:hypothetical protein